MRKEKHEKTTTKKTYKINGSNKHESTSQSNRVIMCAMDWKNGWTKKKWLFEIQFRNYENISIVDAIYLVIGFVHRP